MGAEGWDVADGFENVRRWDCKDAGDGEGEGDEEGAECELHFDDWILMAWLIGYFVLAARKKECNLGHQDQSWKITSVDVV